MFHAIVVFLVSGFVAVNSEMRSLLPTQCNVMYKASCQQFRVVGDHNMICGDKPQYNHCQQTCHSASCRLRCNAHITCQQQCAAGRCDVMTCTSGNCSQSCIRSGCKMDCAGNECQQHCYMGGCNMECSPTAERCFQSCEMGKCNMRCPAGVKACEQTCKGGRCIMICEAKTCKRSCEEGGQCSYSTKVARESKDLAPRYCDGSAGSDRNCLQACVEGRCKLKYKYSDHSSIVQLCHGGNCEFDCKAPLKCTQICTGGRCRKYVCNSKLCIQECVAGGCLMECEAETCFQMCRGGDCSMHCFSNVNDCFQWCTGGNCILKCSAKHCNPFCNTAKCITDGERPRLKAMKRRVRCTMTTRQCKQVCPPKRSCAFMGWKHLHVFHSTNQVCDEGDCRQMICYASKSCNQICNDGACGRMACKSDTCVQDCLGANCNMDCRARNCTQLCRGGGCKMTCRGNTETCIQLCNTRISDCQLICFAKACLITLP